MKFAYESTKSARNNKRKLIKVKLNLSLKSELEASTQKQKFTGAKEMILRERDAPRRRRKRKIKLVISAPSCCNTMGLSLHYCVTLRKLIQQLYVVINLLRKLTFRVKFAYESTKSARNNKRKLIFLPESLTR